uniref:DUF547 domain-containing protein n=1 Tax=Lotharella globosa TaxID=91324 RepID=A0A7S4DQC3_9EUKA
MVRLTHQLQKCDPSILSREERMAFFINIYNTLIVHAMVVRGPPKDFAARLLFYGEIKYVIGGEKYSCDDIENGVLRGNRASPASVGEILPFMKPKGPFKDGDGRIKQVINPPDARIHFALNCGAKSCPAIKVYTPAALLPGLQAAAEAFCSDPANVDFDQDTSTLKLSKIFQWYRGDFGSDEQLQGLLKEAVVGERGEELGRFFDSAGGKVNYEFVPYDWDLNEA